ncbi:MAG: lysylphosphatidylglycerol synthase transmembrane domain-containing protein [Pseudomonadota bacterium]
MNRPLLRAIQVAVTVTSFGLLWYLADGETAMRQLAEAHPAWIGAALVMLTLQTLLSALRWRLTAGQFGITLAPGMAVREYYLSQIGNQLLPGGVLGDAGRALRARDEAGLLASGQAVLFERLAGQIALFAIFAAGVLGTSLVPGGFDGPAWLLPVTLLIAVGAGLALRIGGDGDSAAGHVRSTVHGFRVAFMHAVAAREIRTRQLALSLGTAACNVTAFACCVSAVDASLSAPAAMVTVPLILLSMLIPFTVSGWGLREGAAAALLPLAVGTGADGLAASVAFGFTLLLATTPGLIALAFVAAPDPANEQLRS